jgi:hypothetical protein
MVAQKKAAGKKAAPSTKPLWQKLFIKGGTVLLMHAPPGYDKLFAGSPAKVSTRGSGLSDTVVLFAKDVAHLESTLPTAVGRLGPSATLWIAYRKGDKALHRDTLWKLAGEHGYTGVSLVAVDDVWSAMRFKRATGA